MSVYRWNAPLCLLLCMDYCATACALAMYNCALCLHFSIPRTCLEQLCSPIRAYPDYWTQPVEGFQISGFLDAVWRRILTEHSIFGIIRKSDQNNQPDCWKLSELMKVVLNQEWKNSPKRFLILCNQFAKCRKLILLNLPCPYSSWWHSNNI